MDANEDLNTSGVEPTNRENKRTASFDKTFLRLCWSCVKEIKREMRLAPNVFALFHRGILGIAGRL